jgi:uncharacterized membrane protein
VSYQTVLLSINAVACGLIAVRLLMYRRHGAVHRMVGAWFAYALIVACAAVVIRVVTGHYPFADWAETLINLTLCAAVYTARGNVMHLFRRKVDE